MYGLPQSGGGYAPLVYDAAPVGRRAMAWVIDAAAVFVVGVILSLFTMHRITSSFTTVTGLKGKSAWDVLTSRAEIEHASLGLWHSTVLDVEEALAVLVLVEFVYLFTALALKGRTLGKAVLDIQVRVPVGGLANGDLTTGQAARRAAVMTVTDTGLYSFSCVMLLSGSFTIAFLCWLLAVVGFWGNVLPIVGQYRRTVSDLAAGTVVVRTSIYRSVIRGDAPAVVPSTPGLSMPGLSTPGLSTPGMSVPPQMPGPYAEWPSQHDLPIPDEPSPYGEHP